MTGPGSGTNSLEANLWEDQVPHEKVNHRIEELKKLVGPEGLAVRLSQNSSFFAFVQIRGIGRLK